MADIGAPKRLLAVRERQAVLPAVLEPLTDEHIREGIHAGAAHAGLPHAGLPHADGADHLAGGQERVAAEAGMAPFDRPTAAAG